MFSILPVPSTEDVKYVNVPVKEILYENISKYPTVTLDYTITTPKEYKYEDLLKVLKSFNNKYIKEHNLVDVYEDEKEKKYTIRYIIGSEEKTLETKDLEKFKTKFMEHITKNSLEIYS